MKRILILVFLILLNSLIFPDWVKIGESRNGDNLFEVNISTIENTVVDFQLDGYYWEQFTQRGETYSRISYPQEGKFLEIGKPDLPRFTRLIAVADEGEVELEIIAKQSQKLDDILIYPQQKLRSESKPYDSTFMIDDQFYNGNELFPTKFCEIGSPAIMRDLRLVSLTINPFRFDPEAKELEIITDVSVRITTSGRGGENIKTRSGDRSRFFEPLYQANILNYNDIFSRDDEMQMPSYLIIYPSNDFYAQMWVDSLYYWKHRKGFKVEAVGVTGSSSNFSVVKNIIQDAYDNWEDPPEFVCLIGDTDRIDTSSIYSGEGDHPYTLLEGYDILADLYIGRLSYTSSAPGADLHLIISKIFNYERNPYIEDTNWFKNVLLVGDTSPSGPSTQTTCLEIKEMIHMQDPVFTFDEFYGSDPDENSMDNSLTSGVGYFAYRGYLGMSGWSPGSHNNGLKLYNAVIPTCGTGDFDGSTSTTESMLRSGSVSNLKGAVTAIGTSTIYTHTCFNNTIITGAFHAIFAEGIHNMGGALVRGKLNLYLNYPQTGVMDQVEAFSYWNNLIGDPGMEVWTDIPELMQVSYPEVVGVGTNYLDVLVSDENNNPLEGALVTALLGDDEIFSAAYTDEQGLVALDIFHENYAEVDLTVTNHNFIPFLSTFQIVQNDISLNIDSYQIDDDDQGSSSGNQDGLINPGESIELIVDLKNYGLLTASNVTAEITSSSPYITIIDDVENYGDIESGKSNSSLDDYDFTVAGSTIGGTEIILDCTIYSEEREQFIDHIYLMVDAPNLYTSNYHIFDSDNQTLDPGETAEMVVTISNMGTLFAEDIYGTISCENDLININDDSGFFGNINAGGNATCSTDPFQLTAYPEVFTGSQFILNLHLYNDNGYDNIVDFILEIGTVSVDDPLGPDSYGYFCFDDGDQDYDIAPEYDWIEISSTGTSIPLYDNTSEDGDIAVIDLPFTIRFYGMNYNQITVCSNGWITPGETEINAAMNWTIPGPGGPSPMIAPFWDDLLVSGDGVYYQYFPNDHYFIVEWDALENEANSSVTETFQVLLYDQNYHPTNSGDSIIKFQYQDVNNIDAGYYPNPGLTHVEHGQYATVGLEDHTGTIGLEYTFNNQYPTAARVLQDNLALLFITESSLSPAELNLDNDHFDFILQPEEVSDDQLSITNLGEQDLFFDIIKQYNDPRDDFKIRGNGGPDNYGYTWIDSNEPDGPLYSWIDISGVGTLISFPNNDTGTGYIDLDFNFEFYGTTYDQFRINPNGWIGFGNDLTTWNNTSLPSTNAPRPAILPFWDDLHPWDGYNGGGNVYYHCNDERLVVWFDHVIHWQGTYNGTYDFQSIIYPNGEIIFQYRYVTGDINSSTIGIQNAAGNDGLQISYNNYYVENELAVRIKKINDWLSVDPSGGFVSSGESQSVEISVDTSDLQYGEYQCDLLITTNDPDLYQVEIPVNLIVAEQVLEPPANVQSFINEGSIQLSWDEVQGANYYEIYSSTDPYAPFVSWTLEVSGILTNSWSLPISGIKKFYKIIAVN